MGYFLVHWVVSQGFYYNSETLSFSGHFQVYWVVSQGSSYNSKTLSFSGHFLVHWLVSQGSYYNPETPSISGYLFDITQKFPRWWVDILHYKEITLFCDFTCFSYKQMFLMFCWLVNPILISRFVLKIFGFHPLIESLFFCFYLYAHNFCQIPPVLCAHISEIYPGFFTLLTI